MKKKFTVLLFMLLLSVLFSRKEIEAEEQNTKWDFKTKIEVTEGAFTYHAYTSKDGEQAWIYCIDIDKEKEHSELFIPDRLNDKSVTWLGYTDEPFADDPDYDNEWDDNLFGKGVEYHHNLDGSSKAINGIKKITIPDTVEGIQDVTFSGMKSVKKIMLPDNVTKIGQQTFLGCEKLETVKLPVKLQELDSTAFQNCPKLKSLELSSKNKTFYIKNNCLITKKDKALVYAIQGDKKTMDIPEGVKIIKEYSFSNCEFQTVHIPASVKDIEKKAFMFYPFDDPNQKIKDIKVSKKNKVYAKDGQCIYNKKNKSLSVGIIDNKSGCLRISDKVEYLQDHFSLINSSTEDYHVVVYPKKLKKADVRGFHAIDSGYNMKLYFTAKKPPKALNRPRGTASRPIFVDLYIPSEYSKTYKAWYKKTDCYSSVTWHTYDPKKETWISNK